MSAKSYRNKTASVYEIEANRKLDQALGAVGVQTKRIASTDTAAGFDGADLTDANYGIVRSALITVETNAVRIAFGGTAPTQGASAVGHVLAAGESIFLDGPEDVRSFQFISAVGGAHGVLQVTFSA